MKQIQAKNDAATGWMSSKAVKDVANVNAGLKKKARRTSTAGDLNVANARKLLKEAEEIAKKDGGPDLFQNNSPTKELGTKEKMSELVQGCFPVADTGEIKSSALVAAIRGRVSKNLRCNVVVTITAMEDVSSITAAFKVAKAVKEGSKSVPPNSVISNTVKIRAEPTGSRQYFEQWEHYWNFIINPIFFGYSTTARFDPNKKKHKVILGPPKLAIEKSRLQELERDYDRACADYKREFVRGNISEER